MSGKPKGRTGQMSNVLEYFGSLPWRTERDGERCNILAYAEATGEWEIVAIVYRTSAGGASLMARVIVNIVNERRAHGPLLFESYKAFKGIFEEGLNYTTEQDAEIVYEKLKQVQF